MKTLGTSIYIENYRKEKLKFAVLKLGISEPMLLSILLKKSRRLFSNRSEIFRRVRYQRNETNENYSIYHINFFEVDYEYATSRRYVFKISVSFLIRFAIDNFLDELLEKDSNKICDIIDEHHEFLTNYYYRYFSVDNEQFENVEFWTIPWEKERETQKNP